MYRIEVVTSHSENTYVYNENEINKAEEKYLTLIKIYEGIPHSIMFWIDALGNSVIIKGHCE